MTSHSLPHTARPSVAIIDPNTLAVLGLKQILQDVMPVMTIHTFASFEELQGSDFEAYYHFFVATNIVGKVDPDTGAACACQGAKPAADGTGKNTLGPGNRGIVANCKRLHQQRDSAPAEHRHDDSHHAP